MQQSPFPHIQSFPQLGAFTPSSMSGTPVVTPLADSPSLPQPPWLQLKTSRLSLQMISPSPLFQYPLSTPTSSISGDMYIMTTSWKHVVWRYSGITLRVLAFIFSFGASIAMAVPPSKPQVGRGDLPFSFKRHQEFKYCLTMVIASSIYSAVQLLKGVLDKFVYKGYIMSSKHSEYLTFFSDQAMAYLLFASSSVAAVGTGRITKTTFYTAAVVSAVLSFAAFFALAASAIRSGYKLSKRLIW